MPPARKSPFLALTLGLLAAPVPSALAATIAVPGDQPTVQAAVNAAVNGDVIEVAPGTYAEAVDVNGKDVEIVGTGTLPSDVTIGGATGDSIDVLGGADLELRNLTVIAGTGRAIDVNGATALLDGVAVTGGDGSAATGMIVADGEAVIEDSYFSGNTATGGGSALYVSNDAVVTVRGTQFVDNDHGRGAVFVFNGFLEMERCRFTGNESPNEASAIEFSNDGAGTITSCLFDGNVGGFPIDVAASATVKLYNVTVVDNESSIAGLALNDGSLLVANSIVRDDDVPAVAGSGSVNATHSNVSGGLAGPGMLDVDPMFKPTGLYQLDAGSPCVDAADGSQIPDGLDALGRPRFVDDENVADDGTGAMPYLDMGAMERQPRIRYVDVDAGGAGTGLSWTNAMTDLQAAFDDPGDVEEIWIAAGTYKPDRGTESRSMSFELRNDLAVYGGFAGTEEQRDARDPIAHEVTLGGALGAPGPEGNTYHVVRAENVGPSARLEGVIIQRGYADVADNGDDDGGGILIIGGAPRFVDVTVRLCEAEGEGAAIYALDSDVVFDRLRAYRNGEQSEPFCAILFEGGSPLVVNSRISGNVVDQGSALYYRDTVAARLVNATVWSNVTGSWCAGVFNLAGSELEVHNSIVWGNVALNPIKGQPVSQDNAYGVFTDATYTTVEGWPTFDDRDGHDPRFVDLDGADDVPGNFDDDVRLSSGSCLIDAGDNDQVPGAADRDVDRLERFRDDVGMGDRGNGTGPIVDRGAHEFAGTSCASDIDGDGETGFNDLLVLLASWGTCGDCPADLDCNGDVDFGDLLVMLAAWGPCP